ncbi:MAG: hypothetical protein R3B72_36110 [Polyangiaceae bacterium]
MRELSALLERQVRYVLDQPRERVFISLPRLVCFVEEESRLNAVAREMVESHVRARDAYLATCREIGSELRALLDEHGWFVDRMARVAESSRVFRETKGDAEQLRADLDREVALSPLGGFFEPLSDPCTLGRAIGRFRSWLQWDPDEVEDERHADLVDQFNVIESRRDRALAEHLVDGRTAAGPAWLRLRTYARSVAPPPYEPYGDAGPSTDHFLAVYFKNQHEGDVARLASPQGVRDENDRQLLQLFVRQVRRDVRAFSEEMLTRIGLRLSHLTLMRRFKTRCETYDKQELRNLVRSAQESWGKGKKKERSADEDVLPGKPEDRLTLRIARYLFDQGLTPLIDAAIVDLRPDIVDLSTGPISLYVEAKWYDDSKKTLHALRTMVGAAARQVWETWVGLDGQHEVREAYLVFFRLSGPLLAFEGPFSHAGRVLHPVVIDLAPAPEKGSKAKYDPISMAKEVLGPKDASGAQKEK